MSKKTDNSTLEGAEELSEFELQNIKGGNKTTDIRVEAKEEGAKKGITSNAENKSKKQVSTSMGGNPEGIVKG